MFQNPSAVLYACVSRTNPITILADFNPSNDHDMEASALKSLRERPPFHSTFTHTTDDKTHTYLIIAGENDEDSDKDSAVVFFGIFDAGMIGEEHGSPMMFLTRVKEKFDKVVVGKMKSRINVNRGLQSAADELFREVLGLQSGGRGRRDRGVIAMCLTFLGLAMCASEKEKEKKMKKRKQVKGRSFGGDENSGCALVGQTTPGMSRECEVNALDQQKRHRFVLKFFPRIYL